MQNEEYKNHLFQVVHQSDMEEGFVRQQDMQNKESMMMKCCTIQEQYPLESLQNLHYKVQMILREAY